MNPLWSLQVFVRSTAVAFAHERMMHSWRTWIFLWMGRLVAEISFFALIGRLIGGDSVVFLLVGAAMLAPAHTTMFVAQAVGGLIYDGVVPYLIAAPAPRFPVTLGRSIHWSIDGAIAGSIGLFVGNLAFDLGFGPGRLAALIGLVLLCPLTMLGPGLIVGALAVRWPPASNLLSGLARAVLGLLCGATFAVDHLPAALQVVGQVLPLTHVVSAARTVTAGGIPGIELTLAVATALAWLAIAYLSGRLQFERYRRTGVLI